MRRNRTPPQSPSTSAPVTLDVRHPLFPELPTFAGLILKNPTKVGNSREDVSDSREGVGNSREGVSGSHAV